MVINNLIEKYTLQLNELRKKRDSYKELNTKEVCLARVLVTNQIFILDEVLFDLKWASKKALLIQRPF